VTRQCQLSFIPHLVSVNQDPIIHPDSEYKSGPMGRQLKKQYKEFISALDVASLDDLEDAMNPPTRHCVALTNMSPAAQPSIIPVTQPTIGVWTRTSPSFNLVPSTETRKTSKDATNEAIDFSTSGDDGNNKMNADFSTPSNNNKRRDNNATELIIIVTTATDAQEVPHKVATNSS
jgi:hypothetical protein